MVTYSISKANADIGETITLSRSENVQQINFTYWIIDLQPSDYDFAFLTNPLSNPKCLSSMGKVFKSHSELSATVTIEDNHTIAHTLTPITVSTPTTQYLTTMGITPINELQQSSTFTVDIGEPIEVNFNRNIYNQMKFLVNRWTRRKEDNSNKITSISSSSTNAQYPSAKCVYDNVKDKLERTSNDTVPVIDTLTDDARCKNSWTYWGQYQGLSNLTNSSFSLSAQGTGGVKYTNNDPNEEDVRLTVTLITRDGNAFIGDDEDYDNSSMYSMSTGSDEIFTLEYGSSVWVQYNDTGLLYFTYSVQGVTDGEINSIANIIYPIGSIYMSVNSTSPQVLFGGKWTQLKDRFLLGTGDTYSNGATGGSATVTLTSAQSGLKAHGHGMAHNHNHRHSEHGNWSTGSGSSSGYMYASSRAVSTQYTGYDNTASSKTTTDNNTASNASEAHENMPPYLAVYMWKRTA